MARNVAITGRGGDLKLPRKSTFFMAALLLVLGTYMLYPVLLILLMGFNVAPEVFVSREWGLDHWQNAFGRQGLVRSLLNTFMVWGLVFGISFPVAVVIAWALARVKMPFTHGLEFLFWVSFMLPGIATTLSWILLLDPNLGFVNTLFTNLPFIDSAPFNIYSVPGIIWAHLMANGISIKVMLLTPAFRNMDVTMEEAARVSGASSLMTMLRVTLPLMASPMILVTALQLLRIFQSFEIEQLLGTPFNFHVYSTMIFRLVRFDPPQYGEATVLASMTLLIVALVIPIQRWVLNRRRYTTITGSFKPGRIDLGPWNWVIFGAIVLLLIALTIGPTLVLLLGTFMTRVGYFEIDPTYTMRHWELIVSNNIFTRAIRTTMILALSAGILSPLIFSLYAYILVRTSWRGRGILDTMIWTSGAIPGILSGLGLMWLFLGTPFLNWLYGTIYALILVVVLGGSTTGTNIFKGVFVQVGQDMEDAAKISGAGWTRTYFRIWLPLLLPTMIMIGIFNFVFAAGATSTIILLASRETMTLSILALELSAGGGTQRAQASIVGLVLIALTIGVALVARGIGSRFGIRTR